MDETEHTLTGRSIEMTAELVAAFVSNNSVPVAELHNLIASVHTALGGLSNEAPAEPAGPEKPTAAQIRKSVTPDALISFEDGKLYKTLRRHLTIRGLTPESYRAKYGLAADYPMTTANYSAQRSALAHSLGLGQKRRKAAPKAADTGETISEEPKTRGRKPKVVEASKAAPKARGRKKAAETA
ncbi:MucR family transcriptional regulator [Methylobacterium sp. J-059]|uniref:MucR family transcriptional regulator n=1 Tax=Methylobacterium sp. J-059 TaxID=2836643 RepID=UPI001FBA2825|nr:MucR family transcriptional regulator [Methylobacterium sp. J-059]MCJ2042688.1 MucR family transcriptional regulator [Methylobacterium sp. J-059]